MELSRRHFSKIVTAVGISPALAVFGSDGGSYASGKGGGEPEILRLSRNGWMPNNPHLSNCTGCNSATADGEAAIPAQRPGIGRCGSPCCGSGADAVSAPEPAIAVSR